MLSPSSIVAYEAEDGGSYVALGNVDPPAIQTARRTISPTLSSAFIAAVDSHPNTHQLRLAITNYTESLTRLHPDVGVASGLHLFIAVENLTGVIARRMQRERHLAGRSELAAELGLHPRAGEYFVRDGEIRGCLRRQYIFDFDAEAHAKLKRLSDGVEHGFIDFAEAREIAEEWFWPAAAQVRRLILRESGLDAASIDQLLTGVYERPLALWSVRAVATGILRDRAPRSTPRSTFTSKVTSKIRRPSLRSVRRRRVFASRYEPEQESLTYRRAGTSLLSEPSNRLVRLSSPVRKVAKPIAEPGPAPSAEGDCGV
jgi:hypothetical protein